MEDDSDVAPVIRETHFQGYLINDLEYQKVDARMGYMAMNIYKPPEYARWGAYNDRKINTVWVKRLVADFQQRYNNCSEATCIEVAIRPEWLKKREDVRAVIDGRRIKTIPLLELSEAGEKAMKTEQLIMLGGNHRREAVQIYVEWLEREIQTVEAALKKKEEGVGAVFVGEGAEEVEKLKEKLKGQKEMSEGVRFWAVRLYDRGESTQYDLCFR